MSYNNKRPDNTDRLYEQVAAFEANLESVRLRLQDAPEHGGGPAWDRELALESVSRVAGHFKLIVALSLSI
ncbi:hypothetical protein ACFVMC_29770 [Nocardia sp. NPDC127579]|uniref:hypothetical protein n=1 Tax=Nocardia sp. NPDC127579 TaxID=3345402 RepID=UPI0036382D4E